MKYRFGILSRDAVGPEEMVWLECNGPGHIWHTVSAWEEAGEKVGELLDDSHIQKMGK